MMKVESLFKSSGDRTGIIKLNVIYSVIIRGINILVSLIMVPLTINYINSELYGIWLSLSSIVSWLGFFDIGFGLGLRNQLTTALACKKVKYGKILVSSTYVLLSIIFTVVGIVACIYCRFVNWSYVLNISHSYNDIVNISFQIVIISFCVNIVFQLIKNICQAYQMTALASGLDMLANLFSLFVMFVLVNAFAPSLIYLSAVLCLTPLLIMLLANVLLFNTKFREVAPSVSYARLFVVKGLTTLGIKFFLIQVIFIILYQATNIIISHFCGPNQVTVYNIAYKYLNVAIMAFSILQSPIWSAFNDAYALKDYQWMRTVYGKLLKILILGEICIVVLVLLSPIAYELWVGDSVVIPFRITFLLGLYSGILLVNNLHAVIINGTGRLNLQTVTAWIQGLVFVPLVYVFAINYNLEGILMALIVVSVIPSFFLVRQVHLIINNRTKGIYSK